MLALYKGNRLFFRLIVAIFMCMGLSLCFDRANAAGNVSDTLFEYYSVPANTGLGITTARAKLDDTSAYARMESNSNITVQHILVLGSLTQNGGYSNRTAGLPQSLAPGQAKYLPNYVNENYERYCKLQFSWPARERVSIRIWWSPDSI